MRSTLRSAPADADRGHAARLPLSDADRSSSLADAHAVPRAVARGDRARADPDTPGDRRARAADDAHGAAIAESDGLPDAWRHADVADPNPDSELNVNSERPNSDPLPESEASLSADGPSASPPGRGRAPRRPGEGDTNPPSARASLDRWHGLWYLSRRAPLAVGEGNEAVDHRPHL